MLKRFILGAGLMYLLDAERGNRRRTVLRDKMFSTMKRSQRAFGKTAQHTRAQAVGFMHQARGRMMHEDVNDAQLIARVRAKLGRAVSHPHAIRVTSSNGRITLSGAVLSHEVPQLLRACMMVRGVRGLINQLDVHQRGDIPDLQGRGRIISRSRGEMWSPTTRMAAGAFGGLLIFRGVIRRGILGDLSAVLGAALVGRSISNRSFRSLIGQGPSSAIEIQKTINIHAPIDRVFDFFAHPGNFPHFMANILDVRENGQGRSHWVVAGPTGTKFEWDAETTCMEENRCIAWQSSEGARIQNSGTINFSDFNGTTRVDIRLSYSPPGGIFGHFLARLIGTDPRSEMNSDLARVKTLIETGRAAHDAAQPVAF